MNTTSHTLSQPIRAILIILSLILIQLSVPKTEVTGFGLSSDVIRLRKALSVYQPVMALMASAKAELQNYQQKAENMISKTAEVAKTWKIVKIETKKVPVTKSILWPLKGEITSSYGMRIHPVTGDRSFHSGIDIRGKSGTKVVCPTDGVVVDTGWAGALGRMVKIKTSTGHILCFGHLSKINCKEGQKINRGQQLGAVGSTGRATGPHLHFTVKYQGDYVNPIKYLSKK